MTRAAGVAVLEDWTRLVGGTVEIYLEGRLVRVGRVEQVTADASMLWVEADARGGRMLFDKKLGYKIRPHIPLTQSSISRTASTYVTSRP